jgi:hypothetical protein
MYNFRHFHLPWDHHRPEPPIPPARVTKVALKLRYLIEQLISLEINVSPLNGILTVLGKLVDDATVQDHHQTCFEVGLGRGRRGQGVCRLRTDGLSKVCSYLNDLIVGTFGVSHGWTSQIRNY